MLASVAFLRAYMIDVAYSRGFSIEFHQPATLIQMTPNTSMLFYTSSSGVIAHHVSPNLVVTVPSTSERIEATTELDVLTRTLQNISSKLETIMSRYSQEINVPPVTKRLCITHLSGPYRDEPNGIFCVSIQMCAVVC